jgi:hypothetical protein
MSDAIIAEDLATRVRELVDRFDGGNVTQAAQRIGAREADLRAVIDARSSEPNLAVLSAIVRGYDVDTWWLISGDDERASDLPADRRIGSLNLLSELGATLTLQRKLHAHHIPVLDERAGA